MVSCEECERLRKEEADAWDALQRQRNMNRRMSAQGMKEARRVERRLEEAYLRATFKLRRHKATHTKS
jgi:hypothetical protein